MKREEWKELLNNYKFYYGSFGIRRHELKDVALHHCESAFRNRRRNKETFDSAT